MGTSYHTKTRTNIENFTIDDAVGNDQDVTMTLTSFAPDSIEDANDDVVSLRISVDDRQVLIQSGDLAHLLHPLIEALRFLLAAQTVSEDEFDDAWSAR